MALQHHEFELRLRDTERLRLFVQAGMAEQEMQIASLKQAELTCHRLELEGSESVERAALAEAERDTARHEAAMAKLTTEGALNTRSQIESELARVQNALAVTPPIPVRPDWRIRTEVRGAIRSILYLSIYYTVYCTGTLIDLFFLRAVPVPVVYKQFL